MKLAQQLSGMTGILVVVLLFGIAWMAVDCYAIYIYTVYKNESCERRLALWLVVWAAAHLTYTLLNMLPVILIIATKDCNRRTCNSDSLSGGITGMTVCGCIICFFLFAWLITGSVWVYPDTGVPKTGHTCPDQLYVTAFAIVTAGWVAEPIKFIVMLVAYVSSSAAV